MLSSLSTMAEAIDSAGVLVGDEVSLADLSVAAQLSLLRFPSSAGPDLAGRGVPGISDHPRLQSLFHWRDQLESRLTHQDPAAMV